MKYLLSILSFIMILAINAFGQQGAGSKIVTEIIASSSTAVVKGSPFSAEAVSESVQMLADGNKIARSYTTKMYRDSEGRFRREGGSGGGETAIYSSGITTVGFQDTISIFDPVANVRYILQPSDKTARKMGTVPGAAEGAVIVNGQASSQAVKKQLEFRLGTIRLNASKQVEATTPGQSQVVVLPNLSAAHGGPGKTESLGMRNIEGVEAEGTRTVTTLPAGSVGNERDIEMVYERWYSKDLQLIVYSRYFDPRFGEQTYRLVNINRSEPDRSLFVPPADYKIVAEPRFNVVTPRQ